MPKVEISGRTVTIERFKLDKAMRVITLLQLMQKQAPEVSKVWAEFRKSYGEDYARDVDRMNALALYGPQLEGLRGHDLEEWRAALADDVVRREFYSGYERWASPLELAEFMAS